MIVCRLWFRFLAPVLLLALAGCSALSGGTTAQADKLVRLDPRAWPTQARPSPTPRPTPFPRITLAAAAAPAAPAPAAARPGAAEARAAATTPASGDKALPVGGQVNKSAINLRAGPGTAYAIEGGLAPGASFTVQAANPGRDWLLVSVEGKQGWVEANLVTIGGNAASLPQATPMPAAARPPTPTAAG